MIYKAFVVEESNGKFISKIKFLDTAHLPSGDVLIQVKYSSLNFKDALSATGNKGVTKKYPHTPGIDAAGIISESTSAAFNIGDKVIVTGYDLGMNTPGGFGEYIRVPAEWVIKCPDNLTLKEAMIIGTAGFTAGISLLRLIPIIQPNDGKVIVTGATGGVGSMAVSMLAKLGYETIAITGKKQEYPFLQSLGANEIIARHEIEALENKPIYSSKYAGVIDTVGGEILVKMIKMLKPWGVATTCGSVSSTQLNLTAFPFILRGVTLVGISAQNYPGNLRKKLWERLANDLKPDYLMNMFHEITLQNVPDAIQSILAGKLKGRIIIKISD